MVIFKQSHCFLGEPKEIITKKLKEAINRTNDNSALMVDDTCLGFNAFKGLPGPYIKYFLENLKPEGLYKMLEGFEDKTGYATCSIGYTKGKDHSIVIFEGKYPMNCFFSIFCSILI